MIHVSLHFSPRLIIGFPLAIIIWYQVANMEDIGSPQLDDI